jgi:hypothetical protein
MQDLIEENAKLKKKLAKLQQLDILVLWDGEDGGPQLKVVAPTNFREESEAYLENIWEGVGYGERRPCATLFRVNVQKSSKAVSSGDVEIEEGMTKYNAPNY